MRAENVMTAKIATVRSDALLREAITLMVDRQVSGSPVLDQDDLLVGILTEGDLLRRDENWFAARNVNITVRAGVVKLEGIITDERAHEALRVATQNLAGVRAIDDQLIWMDPRLAIPII